MQKKSLIIGAAMLDIIVTIDRLPHSGEDIYAKSQDMEIGGCAYNVADILKHFKVPYTLFAPVGTGMYAEFIRTKLLENGHTSPVQSQSMDNGYCMCMVENGGERTFLTMPGIECRFEKEWFDKLDIEEYESVYVSGYEIEGEGGDVIIEFLEMHPKLLVYYAPGPRITYISEKKTKRMMALSPVIHLNESEALSYTGADGIESAAANLNKKTRNTVLITLGDKGVYFKEAGYKQLISSSKVDVVDTIGAGDSHIGAVIASRAKGCTFEEAIRIANDVSAMVVSVKGPTLSKEEFRKGTSRDE